MQEKQVTVGGQQHRLPNPFFVLATQNPIEQEGTYPLPEAQQDRFMFNVKVDYPSEEDEFRIIETTTPRSRPTHRPGGDGRRNAGDAGGGAAGAGGRARHPVRHAARPGKTAARTPDDAPDFVQEVRDLGGRPAGRASS